MRSDVPLCGPVCSDAVIRPTVAYIVIHYAVILKVKQSVIFREYSRKQMTDVQSICRENFKRQTMIEVVICGYSRR